MAKGLKLNTDEVEKIANSNPDIQWIKPENFQYNNNRDIFKFYHISKDHYFYMDFGTFKRNKNCNVCKRRVKYSFNEVKQYINENFESIELLSSDYRDCNSKLDLRCKKCLNKFKRSFNDLKNGKRLCPECDMRVNHSIDNGMIDKRLENYQDGNLKRISNIRRIQKKNKTVIAFDVIHQIDSCGFTFEFDLSAMSRGKCCPNCLKRNNKSMEERYIFEYLQNKNIKFIDEKIFEDCKYKRVLLFDFYLEEYNTIIEFDGTQHFYQKFTSHNHKEGNLEENKIRDNIKNKYCLEKGIKLIRIPFLYKTKKEIFNILDDFLNSSSTTKYNKYNLFIIDSGKIINQEYYEKINKDYYVDTSVSKWKTH